jgi:exopolysaccharide/PEP-CTERM locus tyrosine autokinase
VGKISDALNKYAKERSASQPQKMTAEDRKALLTYDRKTGHLVKYDEKTGRIDRRSMEVLKDRGTIQRLLDNQLILPGGKLTAKGLQLADRMEAKHMATRPAEKAALADAAAKSADTFAKTPPPRETTAYPADPAAEKTARTKPARAPKPAAKKPEPAATAPGPAKTAPAEPKKQVPRQPAPRAAASAKIIELDTVVENKGGLRPAGTPPAATAPPEKPAAPEHKAAPAEPVYRPAAVDKNLVTLLQPQSFEAEQFKILRTNILYPLEGKSPRSMMVTSSLPGEGKTFVAANLAVSIALNINKHVLLIDCDLRKPELHRRFGFKDAPGLSNYLLEHTPLENLLLKTEVNRLTILPGGPPPENPSELMSSERMAALIEEVQNRYEDRLIVIDSPPPALTAETGVLARLVDGIILVVRYGKTPRERVSDLVDSVGADKIIGSVFNQVDAGVAKYYGYKKYGAYGYGKKDKKQKKQT